MNRLMMLRAEEEALGLSYPEKVDDVKGRGGGLKDDLL
jgi:hypothetical protein